jgi:hypothetical protein
MVWLHVEQSCVQGTSIYQYEVSLRPYHIVAPAKLTDNQDFAQAFCVSWKGGMHSLAHTREEAEDVDEW